MKKLFGFTLSEILVAMAILGIVSTLTIPNVVSNTTKKQYATAFKTTINSLNNGIQLFEADNGYDFAGNRTQTVGPQIFRKMLEEKLGAKLVTNQSWIAQGVIANYFETKGGYPASAGGTTSVYADTLFTESNRNNLSLQNANNIQNLAFGTNSSSESTYKLPNGTFILVPYTDWTGCNFKKLRWDSYSSNGGYLTPDIEAAYQGNQTNINLCVAYIDVNGPKGPNRITNCMTNSYIKVPTTDTSCTNMTAKELADVFPIFYYDSSVDAATTAGYTVLNDLIKY